jgi:hypothetical protein
MATVQRAKVQVVSTAAKTNGGSNTAGATPLVATAPGRDPIAERAYQIWQESGCPHGKDKEHWFRAEREVRSGRPARS